VQPPGVAHVRRLLPWPARWPALAHAWPDQAPAEPLLVETPLQDVVHVFEQVFGRLFGPPGDGQTGWLGTQEPRAEREWLRLLHDTPDDRVQALAFADWLEEHGDARAEFVRLTAQEGEVLGWLQGACASRWLPSWVHRQQIPGRPLFRAILSPTYLSLD